MIKSFGSRETEHLFHRKFVYSLPHDLQKTALKKLWMIGAAKSLDDLRISPSNRLEKLSGDRKGEWSIRINHQWRICFQWIEGDAYEVEITDYH